MLDTETCRQPGCSRRWTMDIERRDGMATFMCDPHGWQVIEATPEADLLRVTGYEGLVPAGAPSVGGGHRDRRKARRQAERQARRRSR